MRFEKHIDRKGATGGERAQKEILERIKEEIGAETYERIIGALLNGNIENLTSEEQAIVERLRKEYAPRRH